MNRVIVRGEECKGCGLCVESCPRRCLRMGSRINRSGYPAVEFEGGRCTACGICYLVCPEPGALAVERDGGTGGDE